MAAYKQRRATGIAIRLNRDAIPTASSVLCASNSALTMPSPVLVSDDG